MCAHYDSLSSVTYTLVRKVAKFKKISLEGFEVDHSEYDFLL